MTEILRRVWRQRRWLYATYMIVAVTRIPARTKFHLVTPVCDTRLTLENASRSMTKVPHMVLFGLFALVTAAQFNRLDRRTIYWSLAATAALGLIVELEEGTTRTGNCRITDVAPDIVGALAMLVPLAVVIAAVRAARPNLGS
jgi:hypothetical protein